MTSRGWFSVVFAGGWCSALAWPAAAHAREVDCPGRPEVSVTCEADQDAFCIRQKGEPVRTLCSTPGAGTLGQRTSDALSIVYGRTTPAEAMNDRDSAVLDAGTYTSPNGDRTVTFSLAGGR